MPNIIIVDDQVHNRTAYKLALEDANFNATIFLAQDENEAKKLIDEVQNIDVVITDLIMLHESSGIDVLMAAKHKDPLIMVIILTAYERKLDRYKAFDNGAFECIEKGTPGVKTSLELVAKTKSALRFRETALNQLRQQKQIDFLKRYFDPKVFKSIENNPQLLEPKNRMVTVVFWDIRGFSLLCEIMNAYPTLISGFLKEYFETASQIIFKHNGVLDKFIGDGIMAIFGALNGKDKEGKEDAVAAVGAALDLKREFEVIYKKWLQEWTLYTPHLIHIGIGCGINTGEALVGNLGTDLRDYFTAVGSQVNLAARIESISHENNRDQIIISSSTKSRVADYFNIQFARQISDIKNIPGTFDLYEVL